MKSRLIRSRPFIAAILLILESAAGVIADDLTRLDLERRFSETVQPLLKSYCFSCHGEEKQKGKLDLSRYPSLEAVVQDYRRWDAVLEKLKTEEMPPEEAKQQPKAESRRAVIEWIQALRKHEAERNAGDPGPVLARRLSNAEYDYTIRDLTGVDIRPTREFPVDPANEAGFDNSGESLAMSPALLKKYLEAARRVADHLVLMPDGLAFAPHPVITDTDRDKYCVRRIIDFYQRQPTDLASYFSAAWRYKHRAALGKPQAALADFASEVRISSKYLAKIESLLAEPPEQAGPIAALQAMWRELPGPGAQGANPERPGCERMRDFVAQLRQKLMPEVKNLSVRGMNAGSQPLVLWKNRQFAANRLRYAGGALQVRWDELGLSESATQALTIPVGEAEREGFEAAFKRFCAIFPDAFYISERARVYLDPEKEKKLTGRLLSAGFHSMTGYFRDDGPLYELILDEPGRRELDRLWQEFDFIASIPARQHTSFIWFERTDSRFMMSPEFHFARAEDKDSTSEAKITQLAEVYLAKARTNGASEVALEAIQTHFKDVNANVRRVERARAAAESSHLEALQSFAERAYRRPLSRQERLDIQGFYRSSRGKDGMDHEESVRESVVSVLMSPYFCYRIDPEQAAGAIAPRAGLKKAVPLSDYALASRLSYFLWSSMPDAELLLHAAAGDLRRPKVLAAQARRMIQDRRIRGLATEFGGNWLDFRRFEELNSVDRERFKTFDNELRQSMFEEPVRFFVDLVSSNRSVLEFLEGDYTFVNSALAGHYGMFDVSVRSNEWVRVENARRYERGGLLPMSVFLTKNAPGLRTSPVKRGYWVIRRLLGELVPPPPPTVPELPNDEAKLGNLTLRETLARHREDKACAGCHARFDSIGLVFEGYGPVGELRANDLGGRPVETHATFPGGMEGIGLDGLRRYLRERRQDEFLDNLCRKLLAYALGRNLILSDDPTIQELRAKLAADGHRFGSLIEGIVSSPQFVTKRSGEIASGSLGRQ